MSTFSALFRPLLLAGLFLVLTLPAFSQGDTFERKGILTAEETALFAKLQEAGELIYSENVMRYYTDDKHPSELPFLSKMTFHAVDGLIQGMYSYYEVQFSGNTDEMVIHYNYSAGQADWGRGIVLIHGDDRIHTQYSCGASSCITTVRKNGEEVYRDSADF